MVGVLGSTVLVQCKGFVLVLGLCIGVVLAVFDGRSFGRLVLDRGTSGSRVEANLERWAWRWSGIAPSAIWGRDPSVALGWGAMAVRSLGGVSCEILIKMSQRMFSKHLSHLTCNPASLSTELIPGPSCSLDGCVAVFSVAANLLNHVEKEFVAEDDVVFAIGETLREIANDSHG